jgi:uncharacterized membrane protein
MSALDTQISTAFTLLSVLLVFVIGYFAAFFPLAQDLIGQSTPDVDADKKALISKLSAYRVLVGGMLLLTVLTGIILTPLTRRVIAVISFQGPFPTIGAALLLVDVMLLALFVVTIWVLARIQRRIRVIRESLPKPPVASGRA